MFCAINKLYKNVEIDGQGELGIEVVGHAISITNDPLTVKYLRGEAIQI